MASAGRRWGTAGQPAGAAGGPPPGCVLVLAQQCAPHWVPLALHTLEGQGQLETRPQREGRAGVLLPQVCGAVRSPASAWEMGSCRPVWRPRAVWPWA